MWMSTYKCLTFSGIKFYPKMLVNLVGTSKALLYGSCSQLNWK